LGFWVEYNFIGFVTPNANGFRSLARVHLEKLFRNIGDIIAYTFNVLHRAHDVQTAGKVPKIFHHKGQHFANSVLCDVSIAFSTLVQVNLLGKSKH